MTKLLIVNNSMRPVSASHKLSEFVKGIADKFDGVQTKIVNLRDLNLPFYYSPMTPAAPDYEVIDDAAKIWQQHVQAADAIVTMTPEYNYGMAAAQKNAIDWLYAEWHDLPVVAIGYGWSGAEKAMLHLNDVMHKVKANILVDEAAKLRFKKSIDLDGSVIDEKSATEAVEESIRAVVRAVNQTTDQPR